MSFTDRKRHVVTDEHNSKKWGSPFGCLLCGHMFVEGDGYRWTYANEGDGLFRYGNFFSCDNCDDGDEENKHKASELVDAFKSNTILLERLTR